MKELEEELSNINSQIFNVNYTSIETQKIINEGKISIDEAKKNLDIIHDELRVNIF